MEQDQANTINDNTNNSEQPTEPAKKPQKQLKANKEKDMKHLSALFKKQDESTIWSVYKQSGYDIHQTIEQLCSRTGENVDEMKKKLAERKQKTKTHDTPKDEAMEEKKRRLITSEEVFKRIKWDSKFDPDDFIIGYEDRFSGMQETKLSTWDRDVSSESFIPWHRVVYFKQNGTVVWDRKARIDTIFNSTQQ